MCVIVQDAPAVEVRQGRRHRQPDILPLAGPAPPRPPEPFEATEAPAKHCAHYVLH